MQMVPLFRCSNMRRAITFYTTVLDFEMKEPGASAEDLVVILSNGDAALMLSVFDGLMGNAANVYVQNVDELFAKYVSRGLDTSSKENSPVHQAPINQTWGNREFYVTDADGNTLRFCQPLK